MANKHWTDTHFSLEVALPEPPAFIAGQFARLALRIEEQLVARPYSFVNPPKAAHCEIYANVIEGGELTPLLHRLVPGDSILVNRKPNGFLVLAELPPGNPHLWLIASGTGIGPFLSILQTAEPWQRFERIILVHAVRYQRHQVYRQMLEDLKQRHGHQFQLIDFVSRETVPGCLSGRIPQALENGQLEQVADTPISAQLSQVMLCGNPGMISDATAQLKAKGLAKNLRRAPGQISVENYW